MKKKFFFAALATIALASCTNDESVFEGIAQGDEINFAVAKYTPQTRAEHDSDADFTENVTIWSWYNGSNTPVINADEYDPAGTFESGNKYYWPVNGQELDFVSVPTEMANKYLTTVERSSNGNTTLTFDINRTDYHGDNLMTTEVLTSDRSKGSVALLFRHLFAKLYVKVNQSKTSNTDAAWKVTLNSVTLNNLRKEGKVVIDQEWTAANKENNNVDNSWDSTTKNGGDSWTVTSTDKDLTAGAYSSTETYYILPQPLTADEQKITIEYTVETDYLGNTTQPNTVETYTRTFSLSEVTNISAWNMNKVIIYNISINPEETLKQITFTANEEAWSDNIDGDDNETNLGNSTQP